MKAVLVNKGAETPGLAERLAESTQRGAAEDTSSGTPQPSSPYLSLEDAAKEVGLSASTLRQQVRAGRLKGTRVGRAWVTTRKWLPEYQRNVKRKGTGL